MEQEMVPKTMFDLVLEQLSMLREQITIKCTHDFGQLEFLTGPTVRTSWFSKSLVFGHRIFEKP